MNAVELPNFEPGSAEWLQRMTASKVAAVLGLSPWESRFSLWHRMAGLAEPSPDTDQTRRGTYLEDGVARWFADQHRSEFELLPGLSWRHQERPWQAASPDRLIVERDTWAKRTLAVLEVKTANNADEWGEPGTDEVPPYYRAQVVWQLDTLGLSTGYVAVLLGPGLTFAEYRIDYNEAEAAYIRSEAKAFMDSLPGGPAEQRPDVDAHSETYTVLRQINPDIDGDVDVPHHLARDYCQTLRAKRAADAAHDHARNALADHMQTARRAMWEGRSIATRQQRGDSPPFVKAAARLPEFEETA